MPSKLSNLKSKLDKLDIGTLQTTPVNLSKINHVLKIKLVKRLNIMSELVKKVDNISTTNTNNLVKKKLITA